MNDILTLALSAKSKRLARLAGEATEPPPPVASWMNPDWVYLPASTHGDSTAFAARQRDRIKRSQK